MAKNQNNKTSLEKSHSKWSNAKLTMLCLLSNIAVSAVWVVLALKNVFLNNNLKLIFILLLCVSGLTFIITLLLFDKFKR